ncbi:hypothetical protein PIB30_032783 [Stylosanthes scabra]|uniref:Uncharacterized protein n=1 Tax=Stylosanthes scabra TaxID=79078 RepID=A0ABU6VEA7_9FABA|nr:hypothetical protein [Stylosanthes scabra]
MDDSEKLTALKKAYADIILNTAKEAAARIMVSERKAMRFQQELLSTKEEALQMLLRLKQMLDSKAKEAELTSLTQQKKIEELEAQLQEAEEIVRDLRAELRETQDELENLTKHQMHPPVEQSIDGEIVAQENFPQENRLDPYDGSVNSEPDSQFKSTSVSDIRNPTVNGINDRGKCCGSHDHTNNCYINNPDFASIVIRRKEHELYRNGCTQRVRAFERSLFDGNMSAPENSDNLPAETSVRVQEEAKPMLVTIDAKADNISEPAKPDEPKVVEEEDDDPLDISRYRKKRRYGRHASLEYGLHSDKIEDTTKSLDLVHANASPCVLDKSDPSMVNPSILNENEAQKDLTSPPVTKVPTNATGTVEKSGSHNDTGKGEVFLKACNGLNRIKDDKELLDKSDLTREESLPAKSLEVPACTADIEAPNGSPDKLDAKVIDLDEKKNCAEKQNGNVEPQKSCTMTESSRDSRRLAQVARQLISLSEKKWWQ